MRAKGVLHDELVVEPDVLFVRADRLEIVDPDGGVEGPPDLVVEVLSPSNQTYDRNLKRKHYLENGVGELWIADADEGTLEVWTPGATEARQDSGRGGVARGRSSVPDSAVRPVPGLRRIAAHRPPSVTTRPACLRRTSRSGSASRVYG